MIRWFLEAVGLVKPKPRPSWAPLQSYLHDLSALYRDDPELRKCIIREGVEP